jgi:hypothetical protein
VGATGDDNAKRGAGASTDESAAASAGGDESTAAAQRASAESAAASAGGDESTAAAQGAGGDESAAVAQGAGGDESVAAPQGATVDAVPSNRMPATAHVQVRPKRSMSAGKILIILAALACGGLLFWGVVAGVWMYFNGRDFVDDTQAVIAEGQAAGTQLSADGCVDAGIKRANSCAGWNLKCRLSEQLYLTGCLKTAHSGPQMCVHVPATSDIVDSITYRKRECAERGQTGQTCEQLLQAAQMYCDELRKRGGVK